MSTTIKDSQEGMGYGPHRINSVLDRTRINVVVVENGYESVGSFTVPDFIAAVETELNGIFVPRDELPTEFVTVGLGYMDVTTDGRAVFQFNPENETYEGLRQSALNVLAAAEYAQKNPPVDQKQVDALATCLLGGLTSGKTTHDIAHTLIATGKVTVND